MSEKISRLLSLKEASDLLGVSVFTLRRLVDRSAIRAINVGARRLVSASEIERVVRQGAGTPRARKAPSRAQGE